MSWKILAQTSLSDALVKHHEALEELDGIDRLIDWKAIGELMAGIHAKKQGEQAWPPLLMFRRFINLCLSEGVPDHSTIWRFRNTLTKQGLLNTLLLEVNQQLSAKGGNTQDSDAGYNGKKTSTYGYKAHVNVDEDGFIKAVDYTPGNEHDSQSLEKLLTGTEEQVYASAGHDKLLAKRNTGNRILHKAKRNQPLSDPQKYQNRQWSCVRSTVEREFGVLKQHYCLAKARYLGLKRNQTRFMLAAMTYNIKRGMTIKVEMMAVAG
jgi:transposase, IS5 family